MIMRGAIRQFINWWRDAGSSAGAGTADRIPVLAITTDDLDKRALLKFSARGQWDLILSTEWEQALEILKGGRVSVILCDRALPGLDWRDVTFRCAAMAIKCAHRAALKQRSFGGVTSLPHTGPVDGTATAERQLSMLRERSGQDGSGT